jgi:hypothetical protein
MIVLRHSGLLLTAEAPGHRLDHPHRVHDDAHPVAEALT